jgi:hypothetical protein
MVARLPISTALQRLGALYVRIPDAKLSLVEAMRITGFDQESCRALLLAMVDARFLTFERGRYRRAVEALDEGVAAQA